MIYNDIKYDINDEYSFKDFTGRSGLCFEKISGIVYASSFGNETPDNHIFPGTMSGVTFIKCNLDNVFIPIGNTVIDCSQRRFKVQNDGNDWLIDGSDNSVLPINYKIFTKFGLPIPQSKDIPITKMDETVDLIESAKIIKDNMVII